jgi:hypothetical protein
MEEAGINKQQETLTKDPTLFAEKTEKSKRKTLDDIKHIPEPEELYQQLISSAGWKYRTEAKRQMFLTRDRALAAIMYLGDFRAIEVLPLPNLTLKINKNTS